MHARVLLTGTLPRLDNTASYGTVTVKPSRSPIYDTDGKLTISGPQTFPVSQDGTFSIELPASNDPVNGPAFTYDLEADLGHTVFRVKNLQLPMSETTVDLVDAAASQPTPGVPQTVITVPAGGNDGETLIWEAGVPKWASMAGAVDDWFTENPQTASWVAVSLAETDWNELYTAGVYRISSQGHTNQPPVTGAGAVIGYLTVTNNAGGTWAAQEFIRYGNSYERWWRVSRNTSGAWSPWIRVAGSDLIRLTSGDLDTLDTTGTYEIASNSSIANITNLPTPVPGILDHREATNGLTVQTYIPQGTEQAIWVRTTASVTSGSFMPWIRIGDTQPFQTVDPTAEHADRVARARARRGGRIGTSGRGAVALRFDHHTDMFWTIVLPLLEERGLPWAQIINPERLGTLNDSTTTYGLLQDYCLNVGGEVWNHGGNHDDALTEPDLDQQITGSLQALEVGLPGLAVEGWAPPGLVADAYMGASPFNTIERNTGTYAGRQILARHAFIAGYASAVYRPLDPTIQPIGAPHVTADQASFSSLRTALRAARDSRVGVAFMLHPNYVDEPGYISLAVFTQFLDEIVAMRDNGEIMVVSYSGLWLADSESTYRHDLAPSGQSETVVAAGATHSVNMPVYRHDHYLGAPREILVDVTAATSGEVTVRVGDSTVTTHDVTAGDSTIRRIVTLPADATTPIPIVVTPSVELTVRQVRALAI